MKCIITDLNSVCSNCGFFDTETPVNNGYGCNHKDNGEGEYIDSRGNYIDGHMIKIILAKSLTKRNIKCNRRLAKKFIKKARKLNFQEQKKQLKKVGIRFYAKCFDFSCPIAWTVDYDSLKEENNYVNKSEYSHIESEEEMPWGFGDDLMGIEKTEADKLGINY